MGYPICKVEIYGQNDQWSFMLEEMGFDVTGSGDLVQVDTYKRLGVESPAGVFDLQFTLARDALGRTWQERLQPQDLVVIQMMNYQGPTQSSDGAGEMHTVMVGFINDVAERTIIGLNGAPQRRIMVRGQDAGKVFINGMVTYFTFAAASVLGIQEFLIGHQLNGRPDELLERLLQNVYEKYLEITVGPGSLRFWDMLGYNLSSFSGTIPAGLDEAFVYGEQTFWGFFSKIASPPFHELFVDTRRVQEVPNSAITGSTMVTRRDPSTALGQDSSAPWLILRPTPFPYLDAKTKDLVSDAWDGLIRHVIGSKDVLQDYVGEPSVSTLTRSDREAFNLYLPLAQYDALGQRLQVLTIPPIIDEPRLKRYGYKPLTPTTWLMRTDSEESSWDDFHNRLTWKLASWYCLNDQFLSGQKVFRLLPHVHIGERLLDQTGEDGPYEFYIESVSHQFVQNERATTTLGLTRGLRAEQYEQYENLIRAQKLTIPTDTVKAQQVMRDLMHLGQKAPQ